MTERVEYEHGRSNGYADGAQLAQWDPHLCTNTLLNAESDVRVAREIGRRRGERSFIVGYARGFREAIGIGGRT